MSRAVQQWCLLIALLWAVPACAQWTLLGPYGGDARALTYDPRFPSCLYLGTSSSELFRSRDNGITWKRLAVFGGDHKLVLDSIAIDPHSGAIYVAGWSLDGAGGTLFRSMDEGRTWDTLGLHEQSVRTLGLSESNPEMVFAGTLDGIFRSRDRGRTWTRISPPGSAELRNVESLAVDPLNPEIIYAGTRHLPWKTEDGGRTWRAIGNGISDDSEVLSIALDRRDRGTLYVASNTGVYKSEDGGGTFRKLPGIAPEAERIRAFEQDPVDPTILYAGASDGLWRSVDRGQTWRQVTPSTYIVNSVHIDPRNPEHVLLALDRGGVLASKDRGLNFTPSNQGFVHRQVSCVLADRSDSKTLYAGLVNDHGFGGVYLSHDGGQSWSPSAYGLEEVDVLSLAQTERGQVLAGTSRGIFAWIPGSARWEPLGQLHSLEHSAQAAAPDPAISSDVRENSPPADTALRVAEIRVTPGLWLAATGDGLFLSRNEGKSWTGGSVLRKRHFLAVDRQGRTVLALTPRALLVSRNAGASWEEMHLPERATLLHSFVMLPNGSLWLAAHEGAFFSSDLGRTWQSAEFPTERAVRVAYRQESERLLIAAADGKAYSCDPDGNCQNFETGYLVRSWAILSGRVVAITAFDGIVAEPGNRGPSPSGAASSPAR